MNTDLSKKVLSRIKNQDITPQARWRFVLQKKIFWMLTGITVLLGGIAAAIIIFVYIDRDVNAERLLEQSSVEDFLLAIPYLWIVLLVGLAALARLFVRHTAFGYRYATVKIIGAVVAGSVLIGMTLSSLDLGERTHDWLTRHVSYYNALIYTSEDAWSHPDRGLLGGVVASRVSASIALVDFHQATWQLDISSLSADDTKLLQPGSKVKINGTREGQNVFKAQQVFVWVNSK